MRNAMMVRLANSSRSWFSDSTESGTRNGSSGNSKSSPRMPFWFAWFPRQLQALNASATHPSALPAGNSLATPFANSLPAFFAAAPKPAPWPAEPPNPTAAPTTAPTKVRGAELL